MYTCVSNDSLSYLVFDYLSDYKNMQALDDDSLPTKMLDFINDNLFPLDVVSLVDRRKLGPYKYDRAELLVVAIPTMKNETSPLTDALQIYCLNQSIISMYKSYIDQLIESVHNRD